MWDAACASRTCWSGHHHRRRCRCHRREGSHAIRGPLELASATLISLERTVSFVRLLNDRTVDRTLLKLNPLGRKGLRAQRASCQRRANQRLLPPTTHMLTHTQLPVEWNCSLLLLLLWEFFQCFAWHLVGKTLTQRFPVSQSSGIFVSLSAGCSFGNKSKFISSCELDLWLLLLSPTRRQRNSQSFCNHLAITSTLFVATTATCFSVDAATCSTITPTTK